MAIDPRTGQTVIQSPIAQSLLEQAAQQNAQPSATPGGFLGPIALTAAGLFREKRAREDAMQKRQGAMEALKNIDPTNVASMMSFAQAAAGSDDPMLQAFGSAIFQHSLGQPMREFQMNLAQTQDERSQNRFEFEKREAAADNARQMQQHKDNLGVRWAEYQSSANRNATLNEIGRETLKLEKAKLAAEIEAAKAAVGPDQKQLQTDIAKRAAKRQESVKSIVSDLQHYRNLVGKLPTLSPLPTGLKTQITKLENSILVRWSTFLNNENEMNEQMMNKLIQDFPSLSADPKLFGADSRKALAENNVAGILKTLTQSPDELKVFRESVLGEPADGGGGAVQGGQGQADMQPQTQIREGTIIRNPKDGTRAIMKNGQWQAL